MNPILLAQIISIATIITTIFGLLAKEKWKAMLWFFLTNLALLSTYFLLGRLLGAVLVAGAAVRTLVYFIYSKKNLKPSVVTMIFFETYFVIISLLLWKDMVDLFMLANLTLITYTTWQNNMKLLRVGYIFSGIFLISYNIFVGAYVSIIAEIILLVSTAYSIYKYNIANNINNIVLHFYKTISSTYEINFYENDDNIVLHSTIIKDFFNNFVFVKDVKNYDRNLQQALDYLKQNKRLPSMYLYSQNNSNIELIHSLLKDYQLLYHDVWMKLRTGHALGGEQHKLLLPNVNFRQAQEEDKKDVLHVFSEGFVNIVGQDVYKYDDEYIDFYEKKFDQKGQLHNIFFPFIAYYGGKPIATLFCYLNGKNAYLCQITTLNEFRLKGVATQLISHAISTMSKQHGCEEFYLVTEKYTWLETFYLKNNFEEIAQGFCLNMLRKTKKDIYKNEMLQSSVYQKISTVNIPIEEYNEFLKWKNN